MEVIEEVAELKEVEVVEEEEGEDGGAPVAGGEVVGEGDAAHGADLQGRVVPALLADDVALPTLQWRFN